MRKLIIIALILTVSLSLLATDIMRASKKKELKKIAVSNVDKSVNKQQVLKSRSAEDPKDISYTWHVTPKPVTDTKYDYFPGAYQNRPICRQDPLMVNGEMTGPQYYMTLQVEENTDRFVKAYILSDNGEKLEEDNVAARTQRQGYPSLAIEPNTKKGFLAYHTDHDHDDSYETRVSSDMYGLIGDLMFNSIQELDIDNQTFGGLYGTQEDDEYIWPSMFIRKISSTKSRLFLFANNYKSHNPIEGDDTTAAASENVLMVTAILNASGDILPNTVAYRTFPTLNSWNLKENDNWGRFQKGFYVSEDGKEVVMFGYYTEDNQKNRFGFRDNIIRVYYNNDYGRGDFYHFDKKVFIPQENPEVLDPDTDTLRKYFTTENNIMEEDSLFWGLYFGSHLNAVQDDDGRFHVMNTICPQYYKDQGTDTAGFVFYFNTQVVEFVFSPPEDPENHVVEDGETLIQFNTIYPEDKKSDGEYFTDEVFPRPGWDPDMDGEIDTLKYWTYNRYFLPVWHHDLEQTFHENYFRYSKTKSGAWLAAIYGEGAMNYNMHENQLDTNPFYERPGCFIQISCDNGNHWSDPVELYNLWDEVIIVDEQNNPTDTIEYHYDQQLDTQFPNESLVYWYLGDRIEIPSPNVARIPVAFYADNKYGSSVQENDNDEVDEEGGTVYFGVLDIDVSEMPYVDNDDEGIPEYNGLNLNNYPNPFNPETTISFSLKKDSDVNVSIYNVKGQLVKTVYNDRLAAGNNHTFTWKGTTNNNKNASSGVYFIKVKTDEDTSVKKAVLIK